MSRSRAESWSPTRSLAFLAAVLAMAFGAMAPAVVAASPSAGAPMVLCSGGQLRIIQSTDGEAAEHGDQASLTCAMALLSGLAAVPSPDPVAGVQPVVWTEEAAPLSTFPERRPPARAPPPRPPSTAPPTA